LNIVKGHSHHQAQSFHWRGQMRHWSNGGWGWGVGGGGWRGVERSHPVKR
jgi:hypothetical protein